MRPMSTTPPTDDTVDSISGDAAVTVIVSATFATFSEKSIEIDWPTLTMMPFCSIVENPASSTVRS